MTLVTGLLTAGSGFLLAVLWMDLIFDSQIRAHRDTQLPEPVLASIAGYYHRATTTAQPMGRVIALVMATLLVAVVVEAVSGGRPAWWVTLGAVLAGGPVLLAAGRTVPNAGRLGRRSGDAAEQTRLARAIYRDHVVCLVAMAVFLVLQLVDVGR